MSSVIIKGDTSGQITLSAPAVAGTNTLTLPTITGTIGTLNSGTAVASTSGTAINFTSIPAGVRRITVMLSSVSLSGTDSIVVKIGPTSGVESSGYTGSGLFTYDGGTINTQLFSTSFILTPSGAATGAATIYSGQLIMSRVDGNSWVMSCAVSPTASSSGARIQFGTGAKTTADTVSIVQIATSGTNTFDAGIINILYE